MAHELEMIDGKAQIVYTGPKSQIWHGLGTQVPPDLSSDHMLKAAGLDWQVNKSPVYALHEGGAVTTGHSALIRSTDSRVLDVVPDSWKPIQNSQAFEFFHDFVAAGDLMMDTAGSLRDGQLIWGMAKIKTSIVLFGDDIVDQYILFSNPHKFGQAAVLKVCMTRCVCANTVTQALKEKGEFQVRMTHRSEFNADVAKQALGMSAKRMMEYKAAAELMGSKFYNEQSMTEYFKRVFPKADGTTDELSRNGERCMEIVESQPGAEFAKGTFWQLWNSVTYMCDHEFGRGEETRLYNSLYGTTNTTKTKARAIALEMATA